MGELERVVINEPTETENITLEQQAEMQEAEATGSSVEEPQKEDSPVAEERPEWLDEKFKSPEDMAKAYAELQKKLSSAEESTEEANDNTVEGTQQEVIANATLEYEQTGKLSEGTYEALENIGLPQSYVEEYIQGQEALRTVSVTELHNAVGGQEEFDNMISWASESLGEGEFDVFNSMVSTGTPEQRSMAIKGLHARYSFESNSPSLKQGTTSGNAVKPFSSTKELQRAMSDRRYSEVPAYREEVEKRLAVSSIL